MKPFHPSNLFYRSIFLHYPQLLSLYLEYTQQHNNHSRLGQSKDSQNLSERVSTHLKWLNTF